MEAFEIYDVPPSLTFQDYLSICQCARTLADGYDRKVSPARFMFQSLTPIYNG